MYLAIILLLSAVVLMLVGTLVSYVRRENNRNKHQVEQIWEDAPVWGTPPDRN
jgi:ribosomal silencing factor RsfS